MGELFRIPWYVWATGAVLLWFTPDPIFLIDELVITVGALVAAFKS